MKSVLYLAAVSLLAASCSDNAFEELLFRTTNDPFSDTPFADSLSLEHTVYVSWSEDDACDSFRLMRSYDQSVLSFSCIYEGNQTEYTDTDMNSGDRYIYRLDKTRGEQYFEGSTYAYGYSSDCRKDAWECNDTEQDAIYLEHDLICNLPCVRYVTGGRQCIDCDWFYITVPPRRSAEIVISQSKLENESAGAETDLRIQIPGSESSPVKQKTASVIKNTSHETKNFRFKIYPETTGLFSEDSSTAVIEYTVSLSKIYSYSL
ncbi:MAG: hypothetical protein J6K96_00650 [Treponema sp.]|nr:hypothetical protein [Treponema sp.]